MKIYLLKKIVDNAKFEGFGLDPHPSLLSRYDIYEDMSPGYGADEDTKFWSVPKLEGIWKNMKVNGNVSAENDFPCANFVFPVFSERVIDNLGDKLSQYGELLPLIYGDRIYYFYNINNIQNWFDAKNSEANYWCDPPTTAINVNRFAFYNLKRDDSYCFRVFEAPSALFVNEDFLNDCKVNGFKGFEFFPVWPNPYKKKISDITSIKLT